MLDKIYSEISLNWPASGLNEMAGLEGWPVNKNLEYSDHTLSQLSLDMFSSYHVLITKQTLIIV